MIGKRLSPIVRANVIVLLSVLGFAACGMALLAGDLSDKKVICARNLDGGNSPGTYEPDPDNPRRPDREGGPYNEPGSDDDRGRGGDHGGPYNEPGSDGGPY